LVGTTDSNLTDNTTGSGIVAQANGALVVAREANTPFYVNRTGTSDGTLVDFRKDGGTVGSIGTQNGSDFYITGTASDDTGLRFQTNEIVPVNDAGGNRDNAIDLGKSNIRFKDLYLSGGAYLGGTAAANFLDDYEEGTANLSYSASGSSFNYTYRKCYYARVGNKVHIMVNMQLDGTQTLTGNTVQIIGLPFTSVNDAAHQASACCRVRFFNFSSGYTYLTATVGSNTTQIGLLQNGDNVANQAAVANQLSNNSGQIMFTLTYTTA